MGSQGFHLCLHKGLTADSPSGGRGESHQSGNLWKERSKLEQGCFCSECYCSLDEKQIIGSHG